MTVKKSKAEIATIDCSLITIQTATGEFGFQTASQVKVEPLVDTQEAVSLISKGRLLAQKPSVNTLIGNRITLTDNVFNPELALILNGGQIIYDTVDTTKIIGYRPPLSGSGERGEVFTLNAYASHYDSDGMIVQYEKISYPNCHGVPIAFSSQDNVFRVPEYVINSAPKKNEPPYILDYVPELPTLI